MSSTHQTNTPASSVVDRLVSMSLTTPSSQVSQSIVAWYIQTTKTDAHLSKGQ